MKVILGKNKKLYVAEGGFDPPTSGLWAQHASSAPLCWENSEENKNVVAKHTVNMQSFRVN